MAREKEIKINLKSLSLQEFIKRIQKKGFKLEKTIQQTDIYYDTRDWYLYNNLAALRLRNVNNIDNSFSFKKMFYLPDKNDHYFIEEIETKAPFIDIKIFSEIFSRLLIKYDKTPFNSGEKITEYLKVQGYFDEQRMSKVRKVYKKECDEIVIDDVLQVGVVIELECEENEPLELVNTLLSEDEWERSLEGTSYAWLRIVKGLKPQDANYNKFLSNPDWNVWNNEREMYRNLNNA
jgi:adenylate cyclase class IV